VNSCKLFSAFGKFDGVEIVAQGYLQSIGLKFSIYPLFAMGTVLKGNQYSKSSNGRI